MPLDTDDVRRMARLAQLDLSDGELEVLAAQLHRILEYVAKLDEVDVAGVEGTSHAVPLSCPVREDRVAPSLPAEEALGGAPESEQGMFAVPRIIG